MRIAVLDDYQRGASRYADWSSLGAEIDFVHDHLTGQFLTSRIERAQVVVAMRERTPFDDTVFARLPELRLLVTTGMSNASIDLEAASARGVTVCGTRGTDGPAAEMTWALIHAVTRHVVHADRRIREGAWQDTIGQDLDGRSLGLVGLGRLGARVARVGQAFGMQVRAWSQNLEPHHAESIGVMPVSKDVLFAESDVVSLHLRLSQRTRHIVGTRELDSMKPSSILVNTSRAALVDQVALLRALETEQIAGAGLDVFDDEPLPVDHPLLAAPRTVLTPHLGYVTHGSYEVFYGDAVEDVRAWIDGSPKRILATPTSNVEVS